MNLLAKIFRSAGLRPTWALERRLNRRALLYWQSIKHDGELVAVDRFDPQALEDCSAHGFMLDLRQVHAPIVCHVGPVLLEEADLTELPVSLADVSQRSLLGQFARRWKDVLSGQQPVTAEYDFVTESYQILCRGVLLPLSSDGQTIDHVYGVISWKSEKLPAVDA
ncbi:MAG: hypothetical protein JJE34_10515 [Alphaproteobacteria bacterium]|nr:hypothetical protein [Alphaproteobacteria bacterium]